MFSIEFFVACYLQIKIEKISLSAQNNRVLTSYHSIPLHKTKNVIDNYK